MIKLKYQLATLATVALAGQAYAQPVVPDDTQPSCPSSAGAQATGPSCPQPQAQATPTEQPAPAQQPSTYPPPPPPQTTYETQEQPWYQNQFAISVGGGVDDFAYSNAKRLTNMGGGWDARLTMGVHSYLAGELSYIGSAQQLNTFGQPTLYGNGAQGALRINILPNMAVTPFAFGGAAWRHYSTSGSGISSSKDIFEVPAGAGVSAYVADVMFDVRGQYSFTPFSQTADGVGVNAIGGNFARWGVSGNVGAVF
jgi:hypothetical protein